MTGVQKSNTPRCVDCLAEGVTTARKIVSGTRKPRCATHTRAAKKRAQINAHARTTQNTYGLTGEQYWALYEAQGRHCAICNVATGKVKRLAVDHDHDTGDVRGLLCGPCNQMIGRLPKDSLVRALEYLHDPPWKRLLRVTQADDVVMATAAAVGVDPEAVAARLHELGEAT